MTNQDKKAYLRGYLEAGREIDRLQEELARCQSLAAKITPTISDVPGGHGENRLQTAVEKIAELENQIAAKIDEWRAARDKIVEVINTVEDYRLRSILLQRYVQGKTFEQIAVSMHYDYRWITRLHGRALQKLTLESPY